MSPSVRSFLPFASLALFGAALVGVAAAGCNAIVGVGDYATGTASEAGGESSTSGGEGGGDDVASTDGPAQTGPDGSSSGGGEASIEAAADGPSGDSALGADAGPCTKDPSINCTTGTGLGYTCAGSALPAQFFSYPDVDNFQCTTVGSITSATQYCCTSCVADSTVSCSGSSAGYTCFGPDGPVVDGLSTSCTRQASAGGATKYCCSSGSTTADAGGACSANADCYDSNGVCNVNSLTCVTPAGNVGDPCFSDSDCTASGATCSGGGWCQPSTACSSDSSCGSASTGVANQCLTAGSAAYCFPSCLSNSDCYNYTASSGSGYLFCLPGDMVTGSPLGVPVGACGAPGNAIGDPCVSDSDCNTGVCGDMHACTQDCTGSSDTSCGANSFGATNVCAYDTVDAKYECFAGCAQQFDCVAYAGGIPHTTAPTCTSGGYCSEQ